MIFSLKRLWRWLAGTFAALVILLAVALGLFRLMLPQIPAYHAQIEGWASKAVGLPVKLGRLDARWSFGGPELTFQAARLYARDSDQILIEAAEGSVGISLGELLREGTVRPGKVVLEGTRLSLERNEAGILHLTGQAPPAGGAKRAMAPVFQVLPRGSIEFRDAAILYVDRGAGHGPWRFSNVDLAIDHGRSKLLIEGSARLPASLGEFAEFKLNTADAINDPLAIRWQASVRLEQIDLAGVGEILPEGLPEVLDGRADLVANLGMTGRVLQHFSANINLREFVFAAREQQPQGWSRIGGLIEWDREASGWKAAASNLVVERDGLVWPASRFTLEHTASSDKSVEIVYMDASYLRLEDLQPVADWLPEGRLRETLGEMAPRGELRELVINRSLRDGETSSFALRSEFSDLSVNPHESLPGANGLTGKLRMDDTGGFLEMDTAASSLLLPSLFDGPMPVDSMRGSLSWKRVTGAWQFDSEDFKIETPAFAMISNFSMALPDDASPVLDLDARILDLEILGARDYLPKNKLPPMAYRWLYGALVSGRAPETTVRFNGPVRAYPFANGEGVFRARTVIQNMRFAFARDWPAIEGARLEAVLENASYRGRILSGSISGNDVSGSTAEISDFSDPILIMQGQARGTVSDLLAFMRESPVANVLGPRLDDIRGAGGAQTEVVLNLPLMRMNEFRVNGNTAVQAEWLGISGLDQRFTQVDGDINFTEQAVRANDVNANLFGRAVTFDIRPGSNANGIVDATLIEIDGRHSATNLINNLPFPVQAVLAGETDWQATARFPRPSASDEKFNIFVRSNLAGMAVILPEPAYKPAAESRRFTADIRFPADGQINMQTEFGNVLTSNSQFGKTGAEWRHDRSAVRLGGPIPGLPPTEGLVVTGEADLLALDDWISVEWGEDQRDEGPPLLRSVNLQVNRLLAYGQVIPAARVKLDRNAREWLAQVTSDRVEGSLLIPENLAGDEPVFADMVRLVLMPEDITEGEPETADPRDLPAMRITAAEFIYDDMNFGSLEANITRTPYGLLAESIKTTDPGFTIAGNGRWEVAEGRETSSFAFELNASNVLRTLVQLAFDPIMKADAATVTAQLEWPGPPDQRFREQLSGSVSVRVGDGQLLEVEPGAGRMFGLLSIAALPRRLSLDFRDVFDTGFGFDSISGDFELVEGQAYTNNLILKGPAADIGIAGRAGLVARDYDQTAVVRANFGSALPVAGALAAGPAVGAALFIFSEILKDPLKDMSKVFYRVTGSWDEPEFLRVDQAVAEAPREDNPPVPEEEPGG